MAGVRKRVDVSQQEPRAPETPQERRARQSASLADQQAQLRREAEERRTAKRDREAQASAPAD
ncbi:MAG: hypothetical protein LC720_05000 [Actinobacteria bacterium]|nr:hypothetical protein [Actinomycetota bacterium]